METRPRWTDTCTSRSLGWFVEMSESGSPLRAVPACDRILEGIAAKHRSGRYDARRPLSVNIKTPMYPQVERDKVSSVGTSQITRLHVQVDEATLRKGYFLGPMPRGGQGTRHFPIIPFD